MSETKNAKKVFQNFICSSQKLQMRKVLALIQEVNYSCLKWRLHSAKGDGKTENSKKQTAENQTHFGNFTNIRQKSIVSELKALEKGKWIFLFIILPP